LPFSDSDTWLRDIAGAIEMIQRFTSEMDIDSFREDPKTVAAVERKLQIISEAAIRLGTDIEDRIPDLPWREIRGMGNWLRHRYDRIELDIIWKTTQQELPPLKAKILSYLRSRSSTI